MASAKFLEEALSTDVDESAVNAIVGSLENQLVTSTPPVANLQSSPSTVNLNHSNSAIANGGTLSTLKHGVTNGGSGSINNNIILNADANKTIVASTFPGSGVTHSNIVHTVAASLQSAGPASGYVNQTATTNTSQPNYTQLTKAQEAVKLVYPAGSQQLNSSGVPNFNNSRVTTFQTGALPNGNLGLVPITSQNVLNAVTTSSTGIVNHNKQLGNLVAVDPNKQTLVIKTSGNQPLVSIPMTINTTMSHVNTTATGGMQSVVTLAKPISHAASPGMLPANVQIVNVNAVRPQGANIVPKTVSPRVVIGSPGMVGTRPGTPGQQITLQTLQGLQAGTQGHLLLKTENGQYQLLRVGPPPTTQANLVQNNASANANANAGSFRLQTIPAHSAVSVATTTTMQTVIQSQPPALTTQNTTAVQRHTVDTTKEKCRKFLANLLELSSREPKTVERNVRTLIQELIDTKVEPEEFCDRLERLLNASPQPCLIGFLKKSLPLLRQSLVTKELVIDGIRPPPHTVVFSQANAAAAPAAAAPGVGQGIQPQLRPQLTMPTQVRVMSPAQTLAPRLGQALQHRMVTPVRGATQAGRVMPTALRPQSAAAATAHVRPAPPAPPLHVRQPMKALPAAAAAKMNAVLHAKAAAAAKLALNKPPAPALMPKPVVKEKEKKSFHSAGYTGDDDINDVAAMGGVNLAEETQRILGSTEFVGRQIRSCKDEIFLHSVPLQQKIREIAARHGLEEPPPEVTALISHAAQERLKNVVEKLGVMAEHRIDFNKAAGRYEVTQDVKGQLKFLEELDRLETKRHEEQERELLLRAAKSRSKSDDPEQAKLKAKAKEIQRAEMEEVRQREANLTALQAIGSRSKRPRVEAGPGASAVGQSTSGSSSGATGSSRTPFPSRPRVKRVNLRDLLFLLEQEKDSCRSTLLYKSFLK